MDPKDFLLSRDYFEPLIPALNVEIDLDVPWEREVWVVFGFFFCVFFGGFLVFFGGFWMVVWCFLVFFGWFFGVFWCFWDGCLVFFWMVFGLLFSSLVVGDFVVLCFFGFCSFVSCIKRRGGGLDAFLVLLSGCLGGFWMVFFFGGLFVGEECFLLFLCVQYGGRWWVDVCCAMREFRCFSQLFLLVFPEISPTKIPQKAPQNLRQRGWKAAFIASANPLSEALPVQHAWGDTPSHLRPHIWGGSDLKQNMVI